MPDVHQHPGQQVDAGRQGVDIDVVTVGVGDVQGHRQREAYLSAAAGVASGGVATDNALLRVTKKVADNQVRIANFGGGPIRPFKVFPSCKRGLFSFAKFLEVLDIFIDPLAHNLDSLLLRFRGHFC